MDAIKWALVLLCLGSKGIQAEPLPWTATVPSSIKGLPGSCVVIPCIFSYPEPQNPVTHFSGIWMDHMKFIYHPVGSQMMQEYSGRTELLGDPTVKNCSLKIDPLQLSDTGPFYFRVEIGDHDKYSYKESAVSIAMIDDLNPIRFSVDKEVVMGRLVTASCTVTHSCPTSPPVFTWNHPGKHKFHSQQLEGGQWEATSLLTFDPTRADHHMLLQCDVTYKGGRHQQSSKVLTVQYAPEIKTASTCSSDKTMVTCTCIAESSPPSTVHFLLSVIILPNVTVETHGSLTFATLRQHFESSGFVQCLANNTLGSANVTLSILVHDEMKNIYTGVAIGVPVAAVILLVVVLLIKSRGRPAQQSTLQVMGSDKPQRPPQYTTAPSSQRKERRKDNDRKDNKSAIDTNDCIYNNMEVEVGGNYDEIYANM
ncbi:myelin-associated glycoprotein-like isoform X2 [Thalassophryne amazonica]|uniref:myelin-associated glycoprotein-like isoform X2 n=1 Tax=Thalassophryne amazonica TaxID=390379 RepID=UPI001470ACC1|nr:myelin-associated glycoprotein-like isoform X2 [Thalassophryne amazonica]